MGSTLEQGQKLKSVFGQWNPEEQVGAAVEWNGVTSIEVGQLAGIGGWFDVAVIHFKSAPDEIIPLHMAEHITLEETSDV